MTTRSRIAVALLGLLCSAGVVEQDRKEPALRTVRRSG
jgi:hypothetical protein